jgi:hypothetical protein
MKLNKFMALGIFLLTISPMVLAQTQDYCQDNSTVVHVTNVYINVTGSGNLSRQRIWNDMEPEYCPWGCSQNVCRSPPWITYGIILGAVIGMIILYMIFKP